MEKQPTILVIDDSKEFRTIYRDRLLGEGFLVRDAANGEEGLKVLLGEHIDLVLLDIAMPKIDGEGLLSIIRKNTTLAHLPVVILTVFDERILLHDRLMQMGANAYLTKGKNPPNEVIDEIRKLLHVSFSKSNPPQT